MNIHIHDTRDVVIGTNLAGENGLLSTQRLIGFLLGVRRELEKKHYPIVAEIFSADSNFLERENLVHKERHLRSGEKATLETTIDLGERSLMYKHSLCIGGRTIVSVWAIHVHVAEEGSSSHLFPCLEEKRAD